MHAPESPAEARPNGDGTTTANPLSTRCSASARTSGVMPGISGMSTTPGPLPFS